MDTLGQLQAGMLAGTTRLDLAAGLTEFPREILDLAESLEILNLTGNRLRSLPDDLGRLKNLRVLFCSENEFTHLPAVLGECESLSMIGFKANKIETVDSAAFPTALRWLILTDNRINALPSALGDCNRLQKLMLAGNRLSSLPEAMARCEALELIRLSANNMEALPGWLLQLPRLAWLAFAGNPYAADGSAASIDAVPWGELALEDKLGAGASGDIYRARWGEMPVAVKLFKGAMTSDGLPQWEMSACIHAGHHSNLIPVHGQVADHPEGNQGLVMSLIDSSYRPLAGPPSLDSCTRDVFPLGEALSPHIARQIAAGVASAARHLHSRGFVHGDLYAHNVLWNAQGGCYLGDFGAASRCRANEAQVLEKIEVRAFGCLLEELMEHSGDASLVDLQVRCSDREVLSRPSFAEIVDCLAL